MEIPCVPVEHFLEGLSTLEAIEILQQIEVLLGRDRTSHEIFFIFGSDEVIPKTGDPKTDSVDVLMIELDRHSDELNQILALAHLARGTALE